MKKKLKAMATLLITITYMSFVYSCKKDKVASVNDQQLYDLAKETSGFVWFKNSSSILNKSSGSGHAEPFLRTRYNSVAASKLDSNGKIIAGTTFPEGSLIVKELYNNSSTLGRYAILYKKAGTSVTDAKGWVWGYMNSDGSVVESATKKGTACINCHSQSDNIDYMLMNKFYP